jgi:hypothetical protein
LIIERIDAHQTQIGELGDAYEYCRHLRGEAFVNKALIILEEF